MIIYRITNKINGKPYIGQTTRTLEERIYEHRHCKTTTLGKAIKRSEETCKRISESKNGTKMPEKTRALMSAMRKGKPKSDEARANMKLAQAKNRKCVRCIETGEVFSSIRKAAEKYGIDHKNIGRACKKSTRTALGMHWEFVN